MDDFEIIKMYFTRDEQAIRETEIKYGAICNQVAKSVLRNAQDTEECVNDTYLSVWNSIPPQHPNNFKAYICKIVRNISLKRLEYNLALKRTTDLQLSFDDMEDVLPDEHIDPLVEDAKIGKMISDFLRYESADSRNVFIRKYVFFDSINDISKKYSFTESKVKNMLYHTRNRLKKYLRKEGIEI